MKTNSKEMSTLKHTKGNKDILLMKALVEGLVVKQTSIDICKELHHTMVVVLEENWKV